MGHLSSSVPLRDVADVDRFVCAAIAKHPRLRQLRGDERDELEAEGLLLMCELERRYTRARGWPSFSSYAGERLPGRLIDAWHRLHRGEHIRRPNRDGHRVWDHQAISSWEAESERPAFSEVGLRQLGQFARA